MQKQDIFYTNNVKHCCIRTESADKQKQKYYDFSSVNLDSLSHISYRNIYLCEITNRIIGIWDHNIKLS